MVLLSGLFAATNTTIREGRAAFPDFVFGGLGEFLSTERNVAIWGFALKGTEANNT